MMINAQFKTRDTWHLAGVDYICAVFVYTAVYAVYMACKRYSIANRTVYPLNGNTTDMRIDAWLKPTC